MAEVHIRIHNIGSKQAEHFRIELSVDGEKIESCGGKIDINFKQNEFCEVIVNFPLEKDNE